MKLISKLINNLFLFTLIVVLVFISSPITSIADTSYSHSYNFSDGSELLKGTAIVKSPVDNNQLLVTVNGMDVALNISEQTLIIDNKTGLPAALESLKVNDDVFVHYKAAMTKSLPPQSYAIAIVTQIEKDKVHGEFFTVREITSKNDNEVRALNKEGDLIVTLLKGNPLTPFITKQIVDISDVEVGSQLFVWYDIVALSYPGQTVATKAVFVGQEEGLGVRAVYTPMVGAESISITIRDESINPGEKQAVDHNGLLMIPLRSVAEGLGFDVIWNGDDQSILLDDGTINTTLYIGHDNYFKASSQGVGHTGSFTLNAAPMLIDSSTYVPAALFNLLYSDNDAVKFEIE
jgi:hypothetical protein